MLCEILFSSTTEFAFTLIFNFFTSVASEVKFIMRYVRLTIIFSLVISHISVADEQSIIAKEELQFLFQDFDELIPSTSKSVVDSSCIYSKYDQILDEVKKCAELTIQSYWSIFENFQVFQDPDAKQQLLDTFWTYISNMTKRTNLALNEGIPLEDDYNRMLEQHFSVDL